MLLDAAVRHQSISACISGTQDIVTAAPKKLLTYCCKGRYVPAVFVLDFVSHEHPKPFHRWPVSLVLPWCTQDNLGYGTIHWQYRTVSVDVAPFSLTEMLTSFVYSGFTPHRCEIDKSAASHQNELAGYDRHDCFVLLSVR